VSTLPGGGARPTPTRTLVRPPEERLVAEILPRLRDLALVNLEKLCQGAAPELARDLLTALSEDLTDALSQARDLCVALDRPRVGARPLEADPLSLAEQPAGSRRAMPDDELDRIAAALSERAEHRRQAAAIEDATTPLLALLRELDRRLSS